jgi:hypothetical protein
VAAITSEILRCSAWTRSNHVSPIGSAGSYRGYLLVEIPMPWPQDIGDTPLVSSIRDIVGPSGLRVQAMLDLKSRRRRVTAYLNPSPTGFAGFERRQAEYGDDFAGDVEALLADQPDPGGAASAASPSGVPAEVRDVLVCIHGRRDFCCGSLGAELAVSLANQSLPAGVRLWRTSHTGGHRFAPNVIVLPEGTLWAYADEALVERVLTRTGSVAEVVDHYRGCSGLPAPEVQALEREVLLQVGWDLLDRHRTGEVTADGLVRLVVKAPDGTSETWEAEIRPGRTLPVPDCGRPIEEARKSETEWVVEDLRRVVG